MRLKEQRRSLVRRRANLLNAESSRVITRPHIPGDRAQTKSPIMRVLKLSDDDVHHLLAYAQILVGESATMASEAAVLGTPAVYIATTGRGYTDDQEARYGIVRSFTEAEFDQACAELDRILQPEVLQTLGSRARRELLREKIDVTGWMLNFFEDRFAL